MASSLGVKDEPEEKTDTRELLVSQLLGSASSCLSRTMMGTTNEI